MKDYILRITAGGNSILAFIATTRETVNEAARIHQAAPVVTAALGRLLTASAIMGLTLKNDDDILTLNITSDGPVGGLVATSDRYARVKGYAINSQADIPLNGNGKLDISGVIGNGSLNVIKDMGLKEPYVGRIPLVTGEIAEDLVNYYAKSEQIPSAIGLGVLVDRDYTVKQSGGFFIQVLPGADDAAVTAIENKLSGFTSVTTALDEGKTPEDIADYFFRDIGYTVNDTIPVGYYCNCSHTRVEKALISLGKTELEKILSEDGQAVLHCHFCCNDYRFDEQALKIILKTM